MQRLSGCKIKFDPFSVRAPRFAQRCPVSERRLSGSGKRNLAHPLCAPMSAILSARRAGQDKIRISPVIQQAVLRLHSSSHRIRFPKLALTCKFGYNIFSFPPCTAHFLFDVSKRKWGVHPHGKTVYSRAAKWHHAASPAAVRRAPCWSKEKVGDIPMGKAHFRIRSRRYHHAFPCRKAAPSERSFYV